MKNVELFQLFAAKAFADLYESFPVVATISPRELAKAGDHDLSERDASIIARSTPSSGCATQITCLRSPTLNSHMSCRRRGLKF